MEFSVTTDFADAGEHIRQEGSSSKLADKCGLGVLKRNVTSTAKSPPGTIS